MQSLLSGIGLGLSLFLRRLNIDYRMSYIRVLWAFVPLIIKCFALISLHHFKVISLRDQSTSYVIFVLAGVLLWQIFQKSFDSIYISVRQSKVFLTRTKFNWESLIVQGAFVCIFETIIMFFLMIPLLCFYGISVGMHTLIGLLLTIGLAFFGFSVGFVLLPFRLLSEDFNRAIHLVMTYLFFLTPVFYSPPKGTKIDIINNMNPLTAMLGAVREMISLGNSQYLCPALFYMIAAMILFLCGLILYRISMPFVVERMSV
jgi:lipopolysaccharide transport system permease protein